MQLFKSCWLSSLLCLSACSSSNTIHSSWMADNQNQIANKKLTQLILPGSHISNAYDLNKDKNPTICKAETLSNNLTNNAKIAQMIDGNNNLPSTDFIEYLTTEENNITGQLNNGVRYLELQICLQNSSYYTSNYYLTDPLANIITQIKNFLLKNTQEIIIIDLDDNIRAEYGKLNETDINALHNYLSINLGTYLTPRENWQNLTLAKMWASPHRIIILSSNPDLVKYSDIWNKNEIVVTPKEAEYTTIKKLTLIQQFAQRESELDDKFSILPIYSYFSPEKNSLSQISSNPNEHLIIDYLYSLPASSLNIIVSDKQYNHQLVDFAIKKNSQ